MWASLDEPELHRVPARTTITGDAPSAHAEADYQQERDLVRSPSRRVELENLVGPRGVFDATALHVRPGRLADVDATAIPAAEPPLMLVQAGDLEVHEVDMCASSRGRTAPGLPSRFTVVDCIDDDIVA